MFSFINNLKQAYKSIFDCLTKMRGIWEDLNSHRLMHIFPNIFQFYYDSIRHSCDYHLEVR